MEQNYILGALATVMLLSAAWICLRTARNAARGAAGNAANGIAASGGNHPGRRRRRRPRALGDGIDTQSARQIRRFWCYRTQEETLLLVRMRSDKLYCMYLGRDGHGEGARWVVRRVEGEEYGTLAEELRELAMSKAV